MMKTLWSIVHMILACVVGAFGMCRTLWLLLTDMIGDEDYDDQESSLQETTWFNYRTGETDPLKRYNGLYDSNAPHDEP